MLVFATTGSTPTDPTADATPPRWRALRLDAKAALPIDDVVVLAGSTVSSASPQQLTCIGGRVKPSRDRRLLVLPLPAVGHDTAGATTVTRPAIQVLEVGECAVQLLRDVRACFPSLVRKNPLAANGADSDSDSDSDNASDSDSDSDNQEARGRARRATEAAHAQTQAAAACRPLSPAVAAFLAATRVRVMPSLAAFREAYAFESDALAQAVQRDVAGSCHTAIQLLCVEFPPNAPLVESDHALNFGVVIAHERDARETLRIPLPREPRGVFSDTSSGYEHDSEHVVFQDATVITVGSKRESSERGGGKTVAETIQNIRLRHASGTFCTLVLPTAQWHDVVATYGVALPQLRELADKELRSRRFVGVVPNRTVEIVLEPAR